MNIRYLFFIFAIIIIVYFVSTEKQDIREPYINIWGDYIDAPFYEQSEDQEDYLINYTDTQNYVDNYYDEFDYIYDDDYQYYNIPIAHPRHFNSNWENRVKYSSHKHKYNNNGYNTAIPRHQQHTTPRNITPMQNIHKLNIKHK